jgi:hypothetical protein
MTHNPYTDVLKQLSQLLSQLDNTQYAMPLRILNGSSIGQHTRHVIEFYRCLLQGFAKGLVDYDSRERDMELENNLEFVLINIEAIICQIEQATTSKTNFLLAVNYNDDIPLFVETNVIREVVYLVEHSIHHYALIKIGLQENFPSIVIPQHFGIAYSTVRHQATQNA